MKILAADVTPEELQVFLQDTDEQLQLLDEDIIKLENEIDNEELLQEIFRAVHTIKGSSAMVGYHEMANLTHSMESILDRLRKGTLSVTTEIADALLHSLDTLRILRGNLTSSEERDVNVASIIAALEEAECCKVNSVQAVEWDGATESSVAISLNEEERNQLQESLALGYKVYQVGVDINRESQWAAVRCFQVLRELGEKGMVIGSSPSQEAIEAEKVDSHLELICAGLLEENEIRKVLGLIPDLENVRVDFYDPSKVTTAIENAVADIGLDTSAITGAITGSKASSTPSGTSGKTNGQEAIKASETVRIDVERLDSLMNQIGELVVARTRLNQIGNLLESRYKDDTDVNDLTKTFTHITKVVDELQLDITQARMLPVGTVFNRLHRLVRDLSQKAGKKIDFIVEGQETGIDRSVIEHIRDPLVHLLRNAVDHGIEPPEKRKAAGKPERATIRLTAAHEQTYIVITVEDDGKGIDGAVIKESAVRKGIISSEMAANISDAEAIDLIFESGVSTAERATEVSGRGVGMDIVRKNVEAFNGIINVDTKVGEGTRFTLKLPLTLATIQGLLVSSGNTTYAIPLVTIMETLRMSSEAIQTIRQKEVIKLRNKIIPLLRLDAVLGVNAHGKNGTDMIYIVVVKAGERMVGLVVDSLMEPQEVVVKSLGSFIGNIKGIAGASILGSGEVALILDVPSLVKLAVMGE